MTHTAERREPAARIPNLAAASKLVAKRWKPGTVVPLLYVEFDQHDPAVNTAHRQIQSKRAAAAALKACVGTILRHSDVVAAGRGGHWFVALLVGRAVPPSLRQKLDADLGVAAARLLRLIRAAVARTSQAAQLAVRCGWNICEPRDVRELPAAVRHAVRGAALVARVEERRATVLAAISHELRTPLTSIVGFSERLGRNGLSEMQRRRALALIHQEAQRLKRLTDGLVDIGAWNAGRLKLNRKRQSLRGLALRCSRQLDGSREDRKLEVRGDARAWIDGDRIAEALLNVIQNALRYAPPRTAVVVSIEQTTQGAVIAVTDRGPGFEASRLRRLGEPFNVGAGGKIGLGLALAKVLVEAHAGSLDARNLKSRGARVTLSLPYK